MPCLHLYPKDLRIPDWELHQEIVVAICRDCGRILEIRVLSSQSDESMPRMDGAAEVAAKIT
ncbi:MAG: hypothetical protein ACE5OO_06695 [Candidatus Bathyarchaeia archaeon]